MWLLNHIDLDLMLTIGTAIALGHILIYAVDLLIAIIGAIHDS